MIRRRHAPEARPVGPVDTTAFRWRHAEKGELEVRGLPWFKENKGGFGRLPARAEKIVRPIVWELSRQPAGACLAFRTDASALAVRLELADDLVHAHMPFTGSSSVALYGAEDGEPLRWRGTAMPPGFRPAARFESILFRDNPVRMREYRLYLPLYKEVKSLAVGFPRGARVAKATPPRCAKPFVVYGTSITQGACASTAGSDGVALLSRRFDAETINLGFSGNGLGEPEIARLLAEIDPAVYRLDYVANVMDIPGKLSRTLGTFIDILRGKRPKTPILLVTPPAFPVLAAKPAMRAGHHACRDYMMGFYAGERRRGHANLHLADGFALLSNEADTACVDGIHFTDAGFALWARDIAAHLDVILSSDAADGGEALPRRASPPANR